LFTTKTARRVTIIVDATLKTMILDKIMQLGATGYNYIECQGKGRHAITGDMFHGESLLRIEVISSAEVCSAILDYVHATQFAQLGQYALTAFADTVEVDLRDRSLTDG